MTAAPTLRRRLMLAGLLTIGFYVLVVGLAAALIVAPYLELRYANRLHLQLLAAPLAGLALLWAAVPRRVRFDDPGPELVAAEHPQLFALIAEIAQATGERAPDRVFLVGDVNAFVADVGGFFGWRSERVMGLGLPLMRVLDVDEFRAVIAHEFGHYAAGDTRLGGLLTRVRRSMQASIDRHSHNAAGAILAWYQGIFLRLTLSVSRDQERAADRLAAEVTSPATMAHALRNVAGGAALHDGYAQAALHPMLSMGRRPPWVQGFEAYVREAGGSNALEHAANDRADKHEADAFDSHPPLAERVALLADLGASVTPDPTASKLPRATALLENGPDLEEALVVFLVGAETAATLTPMQWSEYSSIVLEAWNDERSEHASLSGVTIGSLPSTEEGWKQLAQQMLGSEAVGVGTRQRLSWVAGSVGRCMGAALANAGWTLHATPTSESVVRRGPHEFSPLGLVAEMVNGERTHASILEQIAAYEIADVVVFGASRSTSTSTSTSAPVAQNPLVSESSEERPTAANAGDTRAGDRTAFGAFADGGLRSRKHEVSCDHSSLVVGDETLAFDDIDGLGVRIRKQNLHLEHRLELQATDRKVVLAVDAIGNKRQVESSARFDQLLGVVRSHVEARLHDQLLASFRDGDDIVVGGCRLSTLGWIPKGARSLRSWDDFGGTTVHMGFVHFYVRREGREPQAKGTASLELMNALLLPDLMQAMFEHHAATAVRTSTS